MTPDHSRKEVEKQVGKKEYEVDYTLREIRLSIEGRIITRFIEEVGESDTLT